MNFVDRIMVNFADPASRTALFDQTALGAIVGSAYDAASINTQGPYVATFDDVELGPDLSAAPSALGSWAPIDGSARFNLELEMQGFVDGSAPAVAATWTGSVSAQAIVGSAHVTAFSDKWTGDGVDFKGSSVVTVSPPSGNGAPASLTFPIVAAVVIADAPVSALDIVRSSALVRARLAKTNPTANPDGLPLTGLPIAVWIVPITTFDDTDWPGATAGMTPDDARTARREHAATWLAAQHVALAAAS